MAVQRQTFRIEGLKELETALLEVPRATAKNVMKRSLMKAGAPVAATGSALAPVLTGQLQKHVKIGGQLTRRQKSRFPKQSAVEVYIGVSNSLPQGHLQEFGTREHGPQPFLRPAWEQHKFGVLESFKQLTWVEIEAAAKRAAKRRARAAKGK